jgi:thiol-disulfide isomerase/thioredoxin
MEHVIATFGLALALSAGLVGDVRSLIERDDFAKAGALIHEYRTAHGETPEMLVALSWLGRGALARHRLDKAEAYAAETSKLALALLKKRPLDADKDLPTALGAAIEVRAQVLAERGERGTAIEFLTRELATYHNTSIRARIQKNLNLLSLEGKPAPVLACLPALAELRGRPVLLFFWAHWCPDCKKMAPVLARLATEYSSKGLVILAPTMLYGFTTRGQEATPEAETKYIAEVWQRVYAAVPRLAAPVNEENFKIYGATTIPTLVVIDRQGIVRLYRNDDMSYEALAAKVAAVM